jgi:hypothetical protein
MPTKYSSVAGADSELDIVMRAAAPLAVQDRDAFLQEVAERLSGLKQLGDGVVYQACREIQRRHFDPPLNHPGPQPRAFERARAKAG